MRIGSKVVLALAACGIICSLASAEADEMQQTAGKEQLNFLQASSEEERRLQTCNPDDNGNFETFCTQASGGLNTVWEPIYTAAQVSTTTGIKYSDPRDLHMDKSENANDDRDNRPALVAIHGGGFNQGSRDQMHSYCETLARYGFVCFSITYRLEGPDNGLTPATEDAKAAVRYLRANAATLKIDPNKIGAIGYSAGGITAMALATGMFTEGASGNAGQSSSIVAAVAMEGGFQAGQESNWQSDAAPCLLFHRCSDTRNTYTKARANVNHFNSVTNSEDSTMVVTNDCEGNNCHGDWISWGPAIGFLGKHMNLCPGDPAPEPTPEPTPEPAPEATPQPTPAPGPSDDNSGGGDNTEPTPGPTPVPNDDGSGNTAQPTPAPGPDGGDGPTSAPTPAPASDNTANGAIRHTAPAWSNKVGALVVVTFLAFVIQ